VDTTLLTVMRTIQGDSIEGGSDATLAKVILVLVVAQGDASTVAMIPL